MSDINWDFIRKLEGFELKGYVPFDKEGGVESGVTICSGFDLGQRKTLKEFNFGRILENKLSPYLGVKGAKAKALLKSSPLVLTAREADAVDKKVKEVFTKKIIKEFEDYSDLTFCNLSQAKQTVFVSVAFQYGDVRRRCPKFFRYATRGMWGSVAAELENFGDDYSKRRRKEAAYLRADLNKKGKK